MYAEQMKNMISAMTPEVPVIFEDDAILVVNKPAGLVVHSDGRTEEPTLTDWVLEHHPECREVGGLHTLDNGRYAPRAGIIHRLDRETSGVVLIAKTNEAFWPLQQQFIDRKTEKEYLAICLGVPKEKKGTIELEIGRSRKDYRQWAVPPDARGTLRPAHTDYECIASGTSNEVTYSYVCFMPKTGRTHQLRVHAKAAGFPIIADERYHTPSALGMERLALHAEKLRVSYQGKVEEFTAPIPDDMHDALKLLNIE